MEFHRESRGLEVRMRAVSRGPAPLGERPPQRSAHDYQAAICVVNRKVRSLVPQVGRGRMRNPCAFNWAASEYAVARPESQLTRQTTHRPGRDFATATVWAMKARCRRAQTVATFSFGQRSK